MKKTLPALLVIALAAEGVHYDADAVRESYHLEDDYQNRDPILGGRPTAMVTTATAGPAVSVADVREMLAKLSAADLEGPQ